MQVNYTLKQLEYFIAAAESETLRDAAERCHVSQVALGVALNELERLLGIKLFIRKRAKGITLTFDGRAILPDARSIVTRATELQTRANFAANEIGGTLHIGCHTGFAQMLMPDVCDTFAARHSKLRIEFSEGSQLELQDALVKGDLEAAFLYERGLPETLDKLNVLEMMPYVLVAADHPLAHRDSVSLRELRDEPLIRLDIPPLLQPVPGWKDPDWQPTVGYNVSSVELVRTLVGRGLGYAVLGQHAPASTTPDGRQVQPLPIREDIPPVKVVLAFARGMLLPRRVTALVEFVRTLHS